MELIKIREELSQYNAVEIFNKEMYHSHNDEEYNFFWRYPNLNLSLKNSGLQRYFLLTEEKEFLTSDHYFREHYDAESLNVVMFYVHIIFYYRLIASSH